MDQFIFDFSSIRAKIENKNLWFYNYLLCIINNNIISSLLLFIVTIVDVVCGSGNNDRITSGADVAVVANALC